MIKRVFDITVAATALIILSPILLILAGLTLYFHSKPILFMQKRPGLDGNIFNMYKFRTMTNECDANSQLLPDAQRLTAFGKWMRAMSLDELPELFNVLRGDMSLVGPRPLLVEYLELYNDEQAQRHNVRPGITGWAQVNGRNAISWEQKFILDVWYVNNQNFWLDIKILFMTIAKVLSRSGISSSNHATMPKFTGS